MAKCDYCDSIYDIEDINDHRKNCCSKCRDDKFLKQRKIKLLKRKGGECERCGYNKCIQSLVFHHKDPTQKKFGITEKLDTNYEELIKELEKCILICSNCHAIKHDSDNL